MRRTSIWLLALTATAVFSALLLIMQVSSQARIGLVNTSWVEWAALITLSVIILRLGLAVRAYLKGDKPWLDMLKAARTLALAKAAEWTGAILFGRYLAAVVEAAQDWSYGIHRLLTVELGISALAALALLVCGYVVERFCELPPVDTDNTKSPGVRQQPQDAPALGVSRETLGVSRKALDLSSGDTASKLPQKLPKRRS